jgi:hypothetical protein
MSTIIRQPKSTPMFCHNYYDPYPWEDKAENVYQAFVKLLQQLDWEYNLQLHYQRLRQRVLRSSASLPIPESYADIYICRHHHRQLSEYLKTAPETPMTIRITSIILPS